MSGFNGYDQWKTASPYDDEPPCEVCGKDTAICECPECPVCNEHGNPACAINAEAVAKAAITGHSAALALMDELSVDDLYSVYRAVYRHTACGPSIGFLVSYVIEQDNGETGPGGIADEQVSRWVYCDDLRTPGAWIPPTYVVTEPDDNYCMGDILTQEQAIGLAQGNRSRSLGLVQSRGTGCNGPGLTGTPYRLTRECMSVDEPMVVVQGVSVSSIVEGVEQCTDTIQLVDAEFTPDALWDAVKKIDDRLVWLNGINSDYLAQLPPWQENV